MTAILAIACVIWGLSRAFSLSSRMSIALILLWLFTAFCAQLVLPKESALHQAIAADPRSWGLMAVIAVAGFAYARWVAWLKRRAPQHEERSGKMSDVEIERYSRQLMLREIGGPGQNRLRDAKVLVIGAGGLGAPALLYLAGAGVGTIGVVDDDVVEGSNLHRQIIHTDDSIGTSKVRSAARAMQALNPYVSVRCYDMRLDAAAARDLFQDYDLILDGTDQFATRSMVNRVAAETGTPLISGAISQWEGQISLFDPANGTGCYNCIFPTPPKEGQAPTCAEAGVIAPLPGVVGTMMALDAIKHITGAGATLRGRMLIYDGLYGNIRELRLKPDPHCDVCGDRSLNS